MPTLIYVMRTGMTDYTRQGRLIGLSGIPLNDVGRRQADMLRRRVGELPFSAVYTSDLPRAQETTRIVTSRSAGTHIILDPRLREKDAGQVTGLTLEEAQQTYPGWATQLQLDPAGYRPPKGESFNDMKLRVIACMNDIAEANPDQMVGVITHGGPLRAILSFLLDLPVQRLGCFDFDYCGVTIVEWGPVKHFRSVNIM